MNKNIMLWVGLAFLCIASILFDKVGVEQAEARIAFFVIAGGILIIAYLVVDPDELVCDACEQAKQILWDLKVSEIDKSNKLNQPQDKIEEDTWKARDPDQNVKR